MADTNDTKEDGGTENNEDESQLEKAVDSVAVEAFRMANGLPAQPETKDEQTNEE